MKLVRRAVAAFAVLGCAAAAVPVSAQTAEPAIPAAQLREDLRVARTALEESHVGLHWYTTPQALDRRFRDLEAALDRPMTAREFYRHLLPLVGSLRHGHTTLDRPVEGAGFRMRQMRKGGAYFPAAVRVLDGRLYVVADLGEGAMLGAGTEIVAIDGRPAAALVDTMLQYLSADGAGDTFRLYQLGPGYYRFHDLLDLLHGPSTRYTVDVVTAPGAAPARRVVPAQSPERMIALHRERTGREVDAFAPALRFEMLGDGVALLTVSSFYEGLLGPGHPGFADFFATTFRRIREAGVRDLVIDVRGNEGGNGDYPALLYGYLADRPFQPANPTILASTTMSTLPYAEGVGDDIRAFAASPGDFVTRAADGTWVLNPNIDEESYRTYTPRADAFTGRLHVLTDGGSFSATNGFLDLVYRYHRMEGRPVRFWGEQNGGDNAFGWASGGQTLQIVLPHSKLRLRIPLLAGRQHFAAYETKAVIPDERITPTIQDVLAGTDPVLRAVRESIAP